MDSELSDLWEQLRRGQISRREFVARAFALGMTASSIGLLLHTTAPAVAAGAHGPALSPRRLGESTERSASLVHLVGREGEVRGAQKCLSSGAKCSRWWTRPIDHVIPAMPMSLDDPLGTIFARLRRVLRRGIPKGCGVEGGDQGRPLLFAQRAFRS